MGSLSPDSRACQLGWWIDRSIRVPLRGCLDIVYDLPRQVGPRVVPSQKWLPREWHTDTVGHDRHSNDRLLLRFYD